MVMDVERVEATREANCKGPANWELLHIRKDPAGRKDLCGVCFLGATKIVYTA